jgi:hypothetical protein
MNYAIAMSSGALTYKPSFIKISSAIQKSKRVKNTQTHKQQGDLISLL